MLLKAQMQELVFKTLNIHGTLADYLFQLILMRGCIQCANNVQQQLRE